MAVWVGVRAGTLAQGGAKWLAEEGVWGQVPLPERTKTSHPFLSHTFGSGSFQVTSLLCSHRRDSWD